MFHGTIKPGEAGISPALTPLPAKAEEHLTELEFRLDELKGTVRDVGKARTMEERTILLAVVDRLHASIRFNARQAAEVSLNAQD